MNGKDVVIEPFLLDRHEVSIGRYRSFLTANPTRRKPVGWNDLKTDQDDLPVAYVGWEDARAYAEWVGKRLPTHGEWVLAARGPSGALFPWPAPGPGGYLGNTRQPWLAPRSLTLRVPLWLGRAAPVRSHPDAATAAGVFHLLGNVAEWTESLGTDLAGTTLVPRPFNRLVLGSAWFAEAEEETLTSLETVGADPSYWSYYIGFRCARSRHDP